MANFRKSYQRIANLKIISEKYYTVSNSVENSPGLAKSPLPYLSNSTRKLNASNLRLNSIVNNNSIRSCSPLDRNEFKTPLSRNTEMRRNCSSSRRDERESVFSSSSKANISKSSVKHSESLLELKPALKYAEMIHSSSVKTSHPFIESSQKILHQMYRELREIAKIDQDEKHQARLKRWRKQRFHAHNIENLQNIEKCSYSSCKKDRQSFGI